MFRLKSSGSYRQNRVIVIGIAMMLCNSLLSAPIPYVAASALATPAIPAAVAATSTLSVTIAGDLQMTQGCAGNWQPECALTHLAYNANSDIWSNAFAIPAGAYQYKAALNDNWTASYGDGNGNNIGLNLPAPATVKFYYDDKTHYVADNVNTRIATVAGDFQHTIGCSGDWAPDCLRSFMEDPNRTGTYTFATRAIPPGNYNFKVAMNEGWSESYGDNGGGNNIAFNVPITDTKVVFSFDSATNKPKVVVGHSSDNNVEYDGLRHDSRDPLYRTPFGSVNPGTPVTLRFRTFANDVGSVAARLYDTGSSSESFRDLTRAAAGVSCYDTTLSQYELCDFWQTTVTPTQPSTLYYRFIIKDGTSTAYYADTGAKLGGIGTATPNLVDNSYPITVFDPAFTPIPWMQNAVIYQIFPDRFRNGNPANDNPRGAPRYDDPAISLPWPTLPEGYCNHYSDKSPVTCPWRFGTPPAWGVGQNEQPRGRDYMGGDLKGVLDKLDYLQRLGVNVIYFNPIFDSASNHGYDTQNYKAIDPYFGTMQDWNKLVAAANAKGIRIILDGVFNHVSSDSPYFNRYNHYSVIGACNATTSPYRSWFYFHDVAAGTGTCAGTAGPNSATYDGWFGFDSIPVLNKNNPAVRTLVYSDTNAVAPFWLNKGAAGWRLDVMGDGSFPVDYWQGFRARVKATEPDAPIIGELWKKDEVLPKIHGDQADTTMNYRFRNAILGLFGTVDQKGFYDDNQTDEPPSLFAAKMMSMREDYPDATFYTLMNLVDSHDTQRLLWSLTPGATDTRADKEFNAANVAQGKRLMKLAALVQFTVPGAPTIYYGDEVAMTGEDDPDDRRTFPWTDQIFTHPPQPRASPGDTAPSTAIGPVNPADDGASAASDASATVDRSPGGPHFDPYFGAGGDHAILNYYRQLADIRAQHPVLRQGTLSFLVTDDISRTMAYMMRSPTDAAITVINRDPIHTNTIVVDVHGKLPNRIELKDALGGLGTIRAVRGVFTVTLAPLQAALLLADRGQKMVAPKAPTGLTAAPQNGAVQLAWNYAGTASFNVYRSPVSGGGFVLIASGISGTRAYTDTSVTNGRRYTYVVTAVNGSGIESAWSNEASAVPAYPIGYAVLQYPKTLTVTIGVTPTDNIYGQVYIAGLTDSNGSPDSVQAQLGFGPHAISPVGWTWKVMDFNTHAGNNFEYKARLRPTTTGTFDLLVRFSDDGGLTWVYGDQNNIGTTTPGILGVLPASDTTPPAAPANLQITDVAATMLRLRWDPVADAAEYWLYRRTGATYDATPLAILPAGTTAYTDTSLTGGTVYSYVVRAVDQALNVSVPGNEVTGVPTPRTVAVRFNVTVPAGTPPADSVFIVGDQPAICNFCGPQTVSMTQVSTSLWGITLTFTEGTNIQYKYTLGDWTWVEKGDACNELSNRTLTIDGSNATQVQNDTVLNWRNIAPCGN